jgi:hypothetical protein
MLVACFLLGLLFIPEDGGIWSFKTSVDFTGRTWCYIPGDNTVCRIILLYTSNEVKEVDLAERHRCILKHTNLVVLISVG